ncbi:MAG TPA: SH3 domain-containing protein [Candidatus Acidoferrum sp.]|nr:SH3 domain-containing protein [Candidatus Acidoferrum sp.]
MRKVMVGLAFFVIIAVAAYLRFRAVKAPAEVGYAGNGQVTLWSSSAQVREPVGALAFGERLTILQRFESKVRVRTATGKTGWINERDMLSSEVWDADKALGMKAAALPVEARGHTRVISNLHVDAGRDAPRIRQLSKDMPVDLLAREPVELPAANRPDSDEEAAPAEPAPTKKEDWWLVRAYPPEEQPLAGWVLGRFIELNVPAPLPDYASSAGMRIVAWFDLYQVKDASGNPKPEYLVLNAKGPEGQPCDFTSLRVYTWGAKRARYETAFVDSGVCGRLPIALTHAEASASEITFSFNDLSHGAPEKRAYRMHQTVVRRIRQGESQPRKRSHS